MCGIFGSISRHNYVQPSEAVLALLKARGPDASNLVSLPCVQSSNQHVGARLTLCSTVLSLRGAVTVAQPYRKPGSDSTLCWNGEAWKISGRSLQENDTPTVFDLLQTAVNTPSKGADAGSEAVQALLNVSVAMARVAGPYAFVFYDASSGKIFFGRDFLGRRSLLRRVTTDGDVLLTSVTDGTTTDNWAEVEADGIYCIDVSLSASSYNLPEDGSSTWGDFVTTRIPYFTGSSEEGVSSVGSRLSAMSITAHGKVIPLLSLNRIVPSKFAALNERSTSVTQLGQLLEDSLSFRVLNIPEPPEQVDASQTWTRAKLAVLFSGGLDCTTLARLVHKITPTSEPVDLLNVAFENPRIHKDKEGSVYELCPDRITGRASHLELCRVCPGREWRFIAIDVPFSETLSHRCNVINLMHPHNTEMDLSIAYALYFAARGRGVASAGNHCENLPYTTAARVLLSGLGADELFGGYTRHATAFRRHGHEGLLNELQLDIGRLGNRNLGRDDRVICHWGREVRFPFLDEDLVKWALKISVAEKCDFASVESGDAGCAARSNSLIEPGKKVLRCLASKLGMENVAREKKRAIQFGARTAKMDTAKTKGTTLLS